MATGYRKLGRTGLAVSEIGFGAWGIGGDSAVWGYGPTSDPLSGKAVQAALDEGCNLFDTADCYGMGRSEKILGKELASRRNHIIFVTKAGFDFYHGPVTPNFHPAYLRFAVYQSLRRLKSDHIDVLLLHNPPSDVIYDPDVIDALETLKCSGSIRFAGVSAADIASGLEAVRAGWPDVIEAPYNMLAPEADIQLIPQAHMHRIGVIAREPMANGFLTGKYIRGACAFPPGDIRSLWPQYLIENIIDQVASLKPYCRPGESMAQLAIRFALEAPGVSTVICGCKSPSQTYENFNAGKAFLSSRDGARSYPDAAARTKEENANGKKSIKTNG